MSLLRMEAVSHSYQAGNDVLQALDLQVEKGEIACLLGQSGCGKTTALRIIAGFERLTRGRVLLNGSVVSGEGRFVQPEKRNVGVVFQDAALFPHMTVAKNIGFGLHRRSAKLRLAEVARLLDLIGLPQMADRYPHQLSGGQRQRVALARAMAPQPALILLDEPFSNLDADLRQNLGHDIRQLLKDSGMTAVLVTHDQHEAFTMADRIGVMQRGRILQMGPAAELFFQPNHPYVASFLGEGSFIKGKRKTNGMIATVLGDIEPQSLPQTEQAQVLIRADDLEFSEDGAAVQLKSRQFRGEHSLLRLVLADGQEVMTRIAAQQEALGADLKLRLKARAYPTYPLTE